MDPFALPLHVADFSTTGRVAVGAVAGLVATVAMNVPMHRLPEGSTPPFVAAGALTGEGPADVDPVLASGTHYAAGVLGGGFYTVVSLVAEGLYAPDLYIVRAGQPLVAHVLAVLATFAFLVAFFAYLVLPRFGGPVYERARLVRRDWTVSAAVYALALAVVVPLLLAYV
ncbi:hypothetical protein [Halosegnis marinus]|uniref:Uncharacterized protein n=1 Tax=Halosegnis marinus TaxID=3034023 RepID=A0ABD5ZLP2_9EURY|nr:hypothetical protein [Halosegnis sp. DT85]